MRTTIGLCCLSILAVGCQGRLNDVSEQVAQQSKSVTTHLVAHSDVGGGSADTAAFVGNGALLATRFQTLDELKAVVKIEYFSDADPAANDSNAISQVRLTHRCNGHEVVGILETGVSQGHLTKVQSGGLWARAGLIYDSPYAIANRADLQRVYTLSRRRPQWFGEGDVAFFDLAKATVEHINTPDLAFAFPRDTSEKGYLNTFNHFTAQAFIASFFSEEIADFVADLHERENMPTLITGKFTPQQLADPETNPVDNYVDIINNEWGQAFGLHLRDKYNITRDTWWTPELLADYLNELEGYFGWAFQIGFAPFRPDDEVVVRFSHKVNLVMHNQYG